MRLLFAVTIALSVLVCTRETALSDATPATPEKCPVLLAIEPPENDRYVILLGAQTTMTTAVTVKFYTQAGSVIVTRGSVAIDTALPRPFVPYRSSAIAITKSSDGPYLAASVTFSPANTTTASCPTVERVIAQEPSATGPLSGRDRNIRKAILDEASAQLPVIPERAPDSKPLPCSDPFLDAAVVPPAAVPPYPGAARLAGATGIAMVEVTLEASGNVADATVFKSTGNEDLDSAAVSAARATKYRAPTFLCRPERGSYIFEAQFNGK